MTTPVTLALPPAVVISPTGVQGPRGNSTLSGARAPQAADGIDGDYWIDTTNYPTSVVLYGPKASGAWPGAGVTLHDTSVFAQLAGDLGGTTASPRVTATHLAAPLPVAQGGTGSAVQSFVDLATDQTINGNKTLAYYTTLQTGQVNGAFNLLGNVGFFGAAAAARQTVTGAKGGNAALASLISALATLGLVTDNTT